MLGVDVPLEGQTTTPPATALNGGGQGSRVLSYRRVTVPLFSLQPKNAPRLEERQQQWSIVLYTILQYYKK